MDNPNEAHAYLSAVSVGELAFLFYGHLLGIPKPHQPPSGLSDKFVPIWPPEREVLSWPPTETVDDVDIQTALASLGEPMGGDGDIPLL